MLSVGITLALFDLNNYERKSIVNRIKNLELKPTSKASVLTFFLFVFYYSLITQFGKGVEINKGSTSFFYLSFFGSSLYYLIDFLLISLLAVKVNFDSWRDKTLFSFVTLLLFLLTTKVVLPYKSAHTFLIVLHFITLMTMFLGEKKNLMNLLTYSFIIVGPLSSFFGFDLIWENVHSLYIYKKELPVVGIIGVWLIGTLYYSNNYSKIIKTRLP
jgi:hypothetical protein